MCLDEVQNCEITFDCGKGAKIYYIFTDSLSVPYFQCTFLFVHISVVTHGSCMKVAMYIGQNHDYSIFITLVQYQNLPNKSHQKCIQYSYRVIETNSKQFKINLQLFSTKVNLQNLMEN